MKSIYVHVFYLSIIAFLSYNYWSSVQAFKAFEHLDRQLRTDYGIMDNSALKVSNEIAKYYFAYKNENSTRYYTKSINAIRLSNDITDFLDENKKQFMNLNGSLDTLDKLALINENSKKTTKLFFTDAKINEIRSQLTSFSKILLDSFRIQMLSNGCSLPKLLADDAYWQSIKSLPSNAALTELSFIQNQIKTDEIICLNQYYRDIQGESGCFRFDEFKTVILPQKNSSIEGETFEAEVFLGVYSTNPSKNCSMKINGKSFELKQGIAHFKSKNQVLGTNTIKAEAFIRNPLTGTTKTSATYFEYQVLPKCSRDCQ